MNSEQKRASRYNVRAAAGGRCEYCGIGCGRSGTLDHWMPKALGGQNERANLRWSCRGCNEAKGSMHPDEWLKVMPTRRVVRQPSAYERRCALLAAIAQRLRLQPHAAPRQQKQPLDHLRDGQASPGQLTCIHPATLPEPDARPR